MSGGVVIYGASGHGKVIADILELKKRLIIGFIDDDPKKWNQKIWDYEITGYEEFLKRHDEIDCRVIVAIGDNMTRKRVVKKITSLGKYFFDIAIHSSAEVAKNVHISTGTVVMAGVVINCDTKIGRHAIINTLASIDHDCNIGDFVHISPGAQLGGGVTIGPGSWIGMGASIINNCRIGRNAIVGMGAVVIKDIPDSWVVVGNPARFLKKNEWKT